MATILRGTGLKTATGAEARLQKVGDLLTNSQRFVVAQDGKFFPMVVISNEDAHHSFAIASHGVHVTRS